MGLTKDPAFTKTYLAVMGVMSPLLGIIMGLVAPDNEVRMFLKKK